MARACGILGTLVLAAIMSAGLCQYCWLFSDIFLLATVMLIADYIRNRNTHHSSLLGVFVAL